MSANSRTPREMWPVGVRRSQLQRQLTATGTRIFTKDSGEPYQISIGEFTSRDLVCTAIANNGGAVLDFRDAAQADMILDIVPYRPYARRTYLPALVADSLRAGKLVDVTKYRVSPANKQPPSSLGRTRVADRTSMYEARTRPLLEAPGGAKRRVSDLAIGYANEELDPEDRITDIMLSSKAQSLEQLRERESSSTGNFAGRVDQLQSEHGKAAQRTEPQESQELGDKTSQRLQAPQPRERTIAGTSRRRTTTPSRSMLLSSPGSISAASQTRSKTPSAARQATDWQAVVDRRSSSRQKPTIARRQSALEIVSRIATQPPTSNIDVPSDALSSESYQASPELAMPDMQEPMDENYEFVRTDTGNGQAMLTEDQQPGGVPMSQPTNPDTGDLIGICSSDGEYPDAESLLRDRATAAASEEQGEEPAAFESAQEMESRSASPELVSNTPPMVKVLGKRRRKQRSAPEDYGQAAVPVVLNEDSGAEGASLSSPTHSPAGLDDRAKTTPQRRRSDAMRGYTPYSASKRIRMSSSDSPLMASLAAELQDSGEPADAKQDREDADAVDEEVVSADRMPPKPSSLLEPALASSRPASKSPLPRSKAAEEPELGDGSDTNTSPILNSSDVEEESQEVDARLSGSSRKRRARDSVTPVRRSSRLRQKSEQLTESGGLQKPAQPSPLSQNGKAKNPESGRQSKRGRSLPMRNTARRGKGPLRRPKSSALSHSAVLSQPAAAATGNAQAPGNEMQISSAAPLPQGQMLCGSSMSSDAESRTSEPEVQGNGVSARASRSSASPEQLSRGKGAEEAGSKGEESNEHTPTLTRSLAGMFSPGTLATNDTDALETENWRPASEMLDELDGAGPACIQKQPAPAESPGRTSASRQTRLQHRRISSHHQLSFCEQVLLSLDHRQQTNSSRVNESLPQSPATPRRTVPMHLRSVISPPSSPAQATMIGGTMRVFGDNEVEMSMADKELMCRHVKGLIVGTQCSPDEALKVLYMCSGNWGLARGWILAGSQRPHGAWTAEEDSLLLQGTDIDDMHKIREKRSTAEVYRRLQFFNEYYS
ncbi:hypothetical protein EC988_000333 [Linderina pennispora]|nr:hypothetical protein EC988_000333 [Linderina pennispora]